MPMQCHINVYIFLVTAGTLQIASDNPEIQRNF